MDFETFKNDNSSGSAELVQTAAELLKHKADCAKDIGSFLGYCKEIAGAHPQMAPIFNLVQTVKKNTRQADADLPIAVKKSISQFFTEIENSKTRIFERCRKLVRPDMRIATFSRSSIVVNTLLEISKSTSFEILLTESRPVLEGRAAARQFSNAGIPVTFYIDAAVQDVVKNADIIFIGADAVTPKVVVNKIGSLPLALCAEYFHTPLYVLATTDKFLPDLDNYPAETDKSSNEIWADAPEGVRVQNRYFEPVLRHRVTNVIS